MKLRQKIAGIVTAIVCGASLFCGGIQPLIAKAESAYGDLTYNTVDSDGDGTDDYVEITDCDESAAEVEIPAEIDGLPVTSIGMQAFRDCISLKSISIPDNITSMAWGAFYNCTSLSAVTIGNGVTGIGAYTFRNCTNLKRISIPDNVTSIDEGAFYDCASLSAVTLGNGVTGIGVNAFRGCTSIESVVIPETVTTLKSAAFCCENLKSITIKNQECLIYIDSVAIANGFDDTDTPYYDGVIYGYENSTAQTYAEKFEFTFELIDETSGSAIQGDISDNGSIDLYDAIEICKSIMGMRTFTEEEKSIADYNGDGAVNIYDAIDIARYIMSNL